jgi:1-acyl-sn-glycerol-3-phosphate acyltransferase
MTTFTLGFSLRLAGCKYMPKDGPVLVIANHQSYLDPLLAGLAARRQLVYLARKTLFRNPWFGGLIRTFGAVPIDQEGVGKEGIKTILEQLQLGRPVLVFPEGERTHDGLLHALKPGIHLLIKRTQAPIVPMGIAGAFDAWPRFRRLPCPAPLCWPPGCGTLAVAMGKPIDARRYAEMPRDEALGELYGKIDEVWKAAECLRRRDC